MIINTGQRTDIPAFFPEWLANRFKEGYVCVRNPYNPVQVSRYRLDSKVVDAIGFCSKNPAPFFSYMDLESVGDMIQYLLMKNTPMIFTWKLSLKWQQISGAIPTTW